jgi:glycosyltransferase involved in cell wall biosynthesis
MSGFQIPHDLTSTPPHLARMDAFSPISAPYAEPSAVPGHAGMTDAILLVTQVALRNLNGELHIDDQTYEGLRHWCEHFGKVTYVGLAEPSQGDGAVASGVAWRSLVPLMQSNRLTVLALPHGYRARDHLRHYKSTRRLLATLIAQHGYLCFSIGALFGDWGAVASLEANAQGRRFAVWFDRVEHKVQIATLSSASIKRRMKTIALLPAMKLYHDYLIRKAALGIFQGKDCFDYYRSHSRSPHLVYDTHTKAHHLIDASELERKIARVRSRAPLRITYAGRATTMKGPEDWIEALIALHRRGVAFEATWFGDGPSLSDMKQRVARAGLDHAIRLHGHVSDREQLLSHLRSSDVFLFCHKTPESPRCLIEALVCGTPLVGSRSAYPEGLLEGFGGGRLTPIGDIGAIVRELINIDEQRQTLETLIRQAAQSGQQFDEETLYRGRATLIRNGLNAAFA